MKTTLKKTIPAIMLGAFIMLSGCATQKVIIKFEPPDPDLCSAGSQSQQDTCPYRGGSVDVIFDNVLTGLTAAEAVNFNDFAMSLDGTTVIFLQKWIIHAQLENGFRSNSCSFIFRVDQTGQQPCCRFTNRYTELDCIHTRHIPGNKHEFSANNYRSRVRRQYHHGYSQNGRNHFGGWRIGVDHEQLPVWTAAKCAALLLS